MVSIELRVRKPTRSKEIDYTQEGLFFITICTHERKCLLSKIDKNQDLEDAKSVLTSIGEIVEKHLIGLEKRYSVEIINYVIMPNHIHFIILVSNRGLHLSNIICAFKSLISRECNNIFGISPLFQRSYYDHVIRNQQDYNEVWEYIENNPTKWVINKDKI